MLRTSRGFSRSRSLYGALGARGDLTGLSGTHMQQICTHHVAPFDFWRQCELGSRHPDLQTVGHFEHPVSIVHDSTAPGYTNLTSLAGTPPRKTIPVPEILRRLNHLLPDLLKMLDGELVGALCLMSIMKLPYICCNSSFKCSKHCH